MTQTKEQKAAYTREYYQRNRERLLEAAKRNYQENKEARRAQRKEYHEKNKERRNAESRAWYRENREAVRERSRRHSREWHFKKHGLTEALFLAMVGAQGGVCLICGEPCPLGRLCIDHDHVTGKVRGLLCRRCNAAIGLFRESLSLIEKAASYLKATKSEEVAA